MSESVRWMQLTAKPYFFQSMLLVLIQLSFANFIQIILDKTSVCPKLLMSVICLFLLKEVGFGMDHDWKFYLIFDNYLAGHLCVKFMMASCS